MSYTNVTERVVRVAFDLMEYLKCKVSDFYSVSFFGKENRVVFTPAYSYRAKSLYGKVKKLFSDVTEKVTSEFVVLAFRYGGVEVIFNFRKSVLR